MKRDVKFSYKIRTNRIRYRDEDEFARRVDADIIQVYLEKGVSLQHLVDLGPKKWFTMGLVDDDHKDGWRAGFTLPTIEARRNKRRLKNKLARQARAKARKENKI